jgi:hypothetical protein
MEELESQQGEITIIEEWGVIDKWWTDDEIRHQYRVVLWNNREIIFRQILPEKVWRIVKS